MPHLKPVGHQSTNWMVRLVLMVATAAFTSFGTTSPRYLMPCFNKQLQPSMLDTEPRRMHAASNTDNMQPHKKTPTSTMQLHICHVTMITPTCLMTGRDTSYSKPYTCRGEDRTSPVLPPEAGGGTNPFGLRQTSASQLGANK